MGRWCSAMVFAISFSLLSLPVAAQTPITADAAWYQLVRLHDPLLEAPGFFLTGVTQLTDTADAQAELDAFLAAARIANPNQPDEHPRCRFPARADWVHRNAPQEAATWPEQPCPALTEWLTALDTGQVTLVFASDYLNNPSSMFGHTLLRLDARGHNENNRLLSYAVNYAAQTDGGNPVLFAWKGLTGGYPGAFSLLPYYEKVKEYNDWESRDLWEYSLNLNEDEILRLQKTLWDWRFIRPPYLFFTRNCSYELLGLLEQARPGLKLQARFPIYAIPADTLRAVVQEPGLLRQMTWRAASGTWLDASTQRNRSRVNRQALTAAEQGPSPQAPSPDLTATEQAQVLETAHDHLFRQHVSRQADAEAPTRLRQLLIARSQLDAPDQRVVPHAPAVDPTQGHATGRWGLGVVHDQAASRRDALLRFRPAYHDWLDAPGGYRSGARVDFLDVILRVGDRGVTVEEASLVAIDSLAPATALDMPISWSIRVGADRVLTHAAGQRRTVGVVEGGGGLAFPVGERTTCFVQQHGDLRAGNGLTDGWEIGLGLRTGCLGALGSLERTRWMAEWRPLWRTPLDALTHQLRWGLQQPIQRHMALRWEVTHDQRGSGNETERADDTRTQLTWLRYF